MKIHVANSHKKETEEFSVMEVDKVKPKSLNNSKPSKSIDGKETNVRTRKIVKKQEVQFDTSQKISINNHHKTMPKVYSETFKKEGLNIDDFQIVPVSGCGVCGTNAIALHIY